MFETEDLVLRKNEKNFVLCLLEVARRASRFGMSAPTLIQMEEEIEEEIREEMDLPPEDTPLPKPQRKPCDFKNLDQMVRELEWCNPLALGVNLPYTHSLIQGWTSGGPDCGSSFNGGYLCRQCGSKQNVYMWEILISLQMSTSNLRALIGSHI